MINIQIVESLQNSLDESSDKDNGILALEIILKEVASEVLSHSGASTEVDLTLVVANDAQIQKLNRDFLGIDAPTDVLAFPGGESDPDTGSLYLGDVILSYEQARIQAASAGQSITDELSLLAVHGILHLLGYDHNNDENMSTMWKMQNEILSKIAHGNRRTHKNEAEQTSKENEKLL